MRALQQHQLYYDADCPLCVAYTGAFESAGILAKGTRQPFHTLDAAALHRIDARRATSEIALLHEPSGVTFYGIDAMLRMLFRHRPAWYRLAHTPVLYHLLKGLYSFISYNRKVIAAAPLRTDGHACTPPLHKGWRLGYMAFVVVLSSLVLTAYYRHFDTWLSLPVFAGREWLTSVGQLVWQGGFLLALVPSGRRWDYLGHMMTVSLAGTLLLLPTLALGALLPLGPWAYMAWFGGVVTYMLYMHSRRVSLLGLPAWLSATWVLYRLLWAIGLMGWQG